MKGLDFQGMPFSYQESHKELKIDDFQEKKIIGIQFITTDNYKKSKFIVEILYSYEHQTLDLGFYKEIKDDSKYISAITLPLIFKDLMLSSYIQKDQVLSIQDQPYFFNRKEYQKIIKNHFQLPIVVLYRHKKCCVNPFLLSQKILGIGHVLCVYNHEDVDKAEIIYPNEYKEIIEKRFNENIMMQEIGEKVRNYMIQENNQFYSFDDLLKLRLQNEHSQNILSSKEFEQYFQDEIVISQNELEQLKEEYLLLQEEYDKLKQTHQTLEKKMFKYNEEALLISYKQDHQEEIQCVYDIIEGVIQTFSSKAKYRKKDVLQSIMRRNI